MKNKNNTESKDWYGCYTKKWTGVMVPDAMRHPAKVSPNLSREIYNYILRKKYVTEFDTVVDPFAGVAGFAYHALVNRLNWVGLEVEQRFVEYGTKNLKKWKREFENHFSTGNAILINDDARFVNKYVNNVSAVVSSPPFLNNLSRDNVDKEIRKRYALENSISSTEYVSPIDIEHIGGRVNGYGASEGQVSSLPAGDIGDRCENTFWGVSQTIIKATKQILKKDGVAIWVTKDFVRDGRVIEFSNSWQYVCEQSGFVLVDRIKAMKVSRPVTRVDLFGEEKTEQIDYKSFFSRINEKKGSVNIDWEDVFIMRKE